MMRKDYEEKISEPSSECSNGICAMTGGSAIYGEGAQNAVDLAVAAGADFLFYPCFLDTVPLLVQQARDAGYI